MGDQIDPKTGTDTSECIKNNFGNNDVLNQNGKNEIDNKNGDAVNGTEHGHHLDTGCSDGGPSSIISVGPPSPLTGCYLLIILGEPHSDEHKEIILQRLLKGFLSWDISECHVDLEEELSTIAKHSPESEEARHGERLIQYASENLVTEVLIHPQYNTLIQCIRNLLSSFTRHRHIIHSGYTFSGNGSWILQDATFSTSDFAEAFQEHDVQRVLRAYPDTIQMNIHCAADCGLWNSMPEKNYARLCKVKINPTDVLSTSSTKLNEFIDYLAPMLIPTNLEESLKTSDVVGNIRFSHPTLYVFPGGQGDAALFGINGFNMLVDGGFSRKACFWDFVRHLDRLDAVLMTRLNNSNINGISAVVKRKQQGNIYPQIGHFFSNIPESKGLSSPDGNKDKNPLLIDLYEQGHELIKNIKSINLKPQNCYRDIEPINLYHKVGHGTLDMYVISPSRDSKEVKEFLHKWNSADHRLFTAKDSKEFDFPIQNLISICALLIWLPANPEDTITRILFPGSTPDFKIIDGLDKIKHLKFMKQPTCTAKSISPAIISAATKKALKTIPVEKGFPEPIAPSKTFKSIATDNKLFENESKNALQDNKIKELCKIVGEKTTKKLITVAVIEPKHKQETEYTSHESVSSEILPSEKEKDEFIQQTKNKDIFEKENELKKTEEIKKKEELIAGKSKPSKPKTEKPRAEVKPLIRSRIDTKPPKSMERKTSKKETITEQKDHFRASPTSTPKKNDLIKSSGKERESINLKPMSKVTKSSPSTTPAKSAKDANNRKVLESKQKIAKITKRESAKTIEKAKTERKQLFRRLRATSPSKQGQASSIKVSKPKAEIRKPRLDKGGTTDSSQVSTPSADDVLVTKKIQDIGIIQDLDAAKQRELDDLKEEQEAVREIEAVFNRDEKNRQKEIKAELREVREFAYHGSATEPEEEEEYLIIEKEEIEQYTENSINEAESSATKEEEIQKHQRDSEESEKKRHLSSEDELNVVLMNDKENIIGESVEKLDNLRKVKEIKAQNDDETIEKEDENINAISKEITSISKDIKIKSEFCDLIVIKSEEISSITSEGKLSSSKRRSDIKDDLDVPEIQKEANLQESLPEEKFSGTIDSGATTAPTLPEDERITLDEIKEDLLVKEKYVEEQTKEADVPSSLAKPAIVPTERILPATIQFEAFQSVLRDVVKTPDEVADLPVHEEADIETLESYTVNRKKRTECSVIEGQIQQDGKTITKEDTQKFSKEGFKQNEEDDILKEDIEITEKEKVAIEDKETMSPVKEISSKKITIDNDILNRYSNENVEHKQTENKTIIKGFASQQIKLDLEESEKIALKKSPKEITNEMTKEIMPSPKISSNEEKSFEPELSKDSLHFDDSSENILTREKPEARSEDFAFNNESDFKGKIPKKTSSCEILEKRKSPKEELLGEKSPEKESPEENQIKPKSTERESPNEKSLSARIPEEVSLQEELEQRLSSTKDLLEKKSPEKGLLVAKQNEEKPTEIESYHEKSVSAKTTERVSLQKDLEGRKSSKDEILEEKSPEERSPEEKLTEVGSLNENLPSEKASEGVSLQKELERKESSTKDLLEKISPEQRSPVEKQNEEKLTEVESSLQANLEGIISPKKEKCPDKRSPEEKITEAGSLNENLPSEKASEAVSLQNEPERRESSTKDLLEKIFPEQGSPEEKQNEEKSNEIESLKKKSAVAKTPERVSVQQDLEGIIFPKDEILEEKSPDKRSPEEKITEVGSLNENLPSEKASEGVSLQKELERKESSTKDLLEKISPEQRSPVEKQNEEKLTEVESSLQANLEGIISPKKEKCPDKRSPEEKITEAGSLNENLPSEKASEGVSLQKELERRESSTKDLLEKISPEQRTPVEKQNEENLTEVESSLQEDLEGIISPKDEILEEKSPDKRSLEEKITEVGSLNENLPSEKASEGVSLQKELERRESSTKDLLEKISPEQRTSVGKQNEENLTEVESSLQEDLEGIISRKDEILEEKSPNKRSFEEKIREVGSLNENLPSEKASEGVSLQKELERRESSTKDLLEKISPEQRSPVEKQNEEKLTEVESSLQEDLEGIISPKDEILEEKSPEEKITEVGSLNENLPSEKASEGVSLLKELERRESSTKDLLEKRSPEERSPAEKQNEEKLSEVESSLQEDLEGITSPKDEILEEKSPEGKITEVGSLNENLPSEKASEGVSLQKELERRESSTKDLLEKISPEQRSPVEKQNEEKLTEVESSLQEDLEGIISPKDEILEEKAPEEKITEVGSLNENLPSEKASEGVSLQKELERRESSTKDLLEKRSPEERSPAEKQNEEKLTEVESSLQEDLEGITSPKDEILEEKSPEEKITEVGSLNENLPSEKASEGVSLQKELERRESSTKDLLEKISPEQRSPVDKQNEEKLTEVESSLQEDLEGIISPKDEILEGKSPDKRSPKEIITGVGSLNENLPSEKASAGVSLQKELERRESSTKDLLEKISPEQRSPVDKQNEEKLTEVESSLQEDLEGIISPKDEILEEKSPEEKITEVGLLNEKLPSEKASAGVSLQKELERRESSTKDLLDKRSPEQRSPVEKQNEEKLTEVESSLQANLEGIISPKDEILEEKSPDKRSPEGKITEVGSLNENLPSEKASEGVSLQKELERRESSTKDLLEKISPEQSSPVEKQNDEKLTEVESSLQANLEGIISPKEEILEEKSPDKRSPEEKITEVGSLIENLPSEKASERVSLQKELERRESSTKDLLEKISPEQRSPVEKRNEEKLTEAESSLQEDFKGIISPKDKILEEKSPDKRSPEERSPAENQNEEKLTEVESSLQEDLEGITSPKDEILEEKSPEEKITEVGSLNENLPSEKASEGLSLQKELERRESSTKDLLEKRSPEQRSPVEKQNEEKLTEVESSFQEDFKEIISPKDEILEEKSPDKRSPEEKITEVGSLNENLPSEKASEGVSFQKELESRESSTKDLLEKISPEQRSPVEKQNDEKLTEVESSLQEDFKGIISPKDEILEEKSPEKRSPEEKITEVGSLNENLPSEKASEGVSLLKELERRESSTKDLLERISPAQRSPVEKQNEEKLTDVESSLQENLEGIISPKDKILEGKSPEEKLREVGSLNENLPSEKASLLKELERRESSTKDLLERISPAQRSPVEKQNEEKLTEVELSLQEDLEGIISPKDEILEEKSPEEKITEVGLLNEKLPSEKASAGVSLQKELERRESSTKDLLDKRSPEQRSPVEKQNEEKLTEVESSLQANLEGIISPKDEILEEKSPDKRSPEGKITEVGSLNENLPSEKASEGVSLQKELERRESSNKDLLEKISPEERSPVETQNEEMSNEIESLEEKSPVAKTPERVSLQEDLEGRRALKDEKSPEKISSEEKILEKKLCGEISLSNKPSSSKISEVSLEEELDDKKCPKKDLLREKSPEKLPQLEELEQKGAVKTKSHKEKSPEVDLHTRENSEGEYRLEKLKSIGEDLMLKKASEQVSPNEKKNQRENESNYDSDLQKETETEHESNNTLMENKNVAQSSEIIESEKKEIMSEIEIRDLESQNQAEESQSIIEKKLTTNSENDSTKAEKIAQQSPLDQPSKEESISSEETLDTELNEKDATKIEESTTEIKSIEHNSMESIIQKSIKESIREREEHQMEIEEQEAVVDKNSQQNSGENVSIQKYEERRDSTIQIIESRDSNMLFEKEAMEIRKSIDFHEPDKIEQIAELTKELHSESTTVKELSPSELLREESKALTDIVEKNITITGDSTQTTTSKPMVQSNECIPQAKDAKLSKIDSIAEKDIQAFSHTISTDLKQISVENDSNLTTKIPELVKDANESLSNETISMDFSEVIEKEDKQISPKSEVCIEETNQKSEIKSAPYMKEVVVHKSEKYTDSNTVKKENIFAEGTETQKAKVTLNIKPALEELKIMEDKLEQITSIASEDIDKVVDEFQTETASEKSQTKARCDTTQKETFQEDKVLIEKEKETSSEQLSKNEGKKKDEEEKEDLSHTEGLEFDESQTEIKSKCNIEESEKKPSEKGSSYEITRITTELRETHITTLDSPIKEDPIAEEIQAKEFESIKQNTMELILEKQISPDITRPVSPREIEVAKIVADVAKVLKSEKDITEILPDFNEKELEKKLIKTTSEGKQAESMPVHKILSISSRVDGGDGLEMSSIENETHLLSESKTDEFLSYSSSKKSSPDIYSHVSTIGSSPNSEKFSPDQKLILIETDLIKQKKSLTDEESTRTSDDKILAQIKSEDESTKDNNEKATIETKLTAKTEQQSKLINETTAEISSTNFEAETESNLEKNSPEILRKESIISVYSKSEPITTVFSEKESEIRQEFLISTEKELNKSEIESPEYKNLNSRRESEISIHSYASAKDILKKESIISITGDTQKSEDNLSDDKETIEKINEIVARKESIISQISDKGTLSDHDETEIETDELFTIREARSKSVASIMMTSIYKPVEEGHSFATLDEELGDICERKESKNFTISQKSETISHDDSTSSSITDRRVSISPECDVSRKLSEEITTVFQNDSSEGISKRIEIAEIHTNDESCTNLGDSKELSDRKTPPTVPVSPIIKTLVSEFTENKSIATLAQTEIVESILSVQSFDKENIKSISENSQISKPEISEIKELDKLLHGGSNEKIVTTTITTITKVISSDGKEVVTEEKTVTTTDMSDLENMEIMKIETNNDRSKATEIKCLNDEGISSSTLTNDELYDRQISDEEISPSPLSIISQTEYSQRETTDFVIDEGQDIIPPQYNSNEAKIALPILQKIDHMSTSVYGSLTEESEKLPEAICTTGYVTSSHQTVDDLKFLDEADQGFEKAFAEHTQVRGTEVMSSITSKYSYTQTSITADDSKQFESESCLEDVPKNKADIDINQIEKQESKSNEMLSKDEKDPVKVWGEPLGLPSPAPMTAENDIRTTPKKERRIMVTKTKFNNEKNFKKRSESPIKAPKKSTPIYIDLTYVPHNGNSYYSHVEFFKRVRARYYVFSGTEPSREVYNALLEAKQTWEDKDLEVTIIPTYDTDVLGYWVSENEELLAKNRIDLSPSASRCTINLQDHETSCSAYRLEF